MKGRNRIYAEVAENTETRRKPIGNGDFVASVGMQETHLLGISRVQNTPTPGSFKKECGNIRM